MERQKDVVLLGALHLSFIEFLQFRCAHKGSVDHFVGQQRSARLQHRNTSISGHMLDFDVSIFLNDDTLLVSIEVSFFHVSDVGLNLFGPRLHGVRVLLGVHLDSISDTSVRVTFT